MNSFAAGLRVQWNVVGALVYRELMTRLSQSRYGIVGIFIDPLAQLAMFMLVFTVLRARSGGALPTSLFLLCGIMLFNLFREVSVRSLRSLEQNQSVLIYRPVRPVDTIIARAVVETGLAGTLYLVVLLLILFATELLVIDNFPLLVFAFFLIAVFSFGVGLVMLVAGHRYPVVKKLYPAVLRPLFITSGIFFSLSDIPQTFRGWISWNPVLQAAEISRHALNVHYPLDGAISLPYLMLVTGLSCATAAIAYLNNERLLMQ